MKNGPGQAFLAVLGFYLAAFLSAGLIGIVLPVQIGDGQLGAIAPRAILGAGAALVASAVFARLTWQGWREQGWPGVKEGSIGFLRGLGIGGGMAALVIAVELALGGITVQRTGQPFSAYLATAPVVLAWLGVAALAEELLFRGFPLARVAREFGPVSGALILATGFAGLHALNPGFNPLGLVNVALASLALSAAFFAWGGMPAAWGLHLGWNATLVLGANAPISGLSIEVPGLRYLQAGPDWLAGGAFGPEGGVVVTVVMVAATAMLGARAVRGGKGRYEPV